MSQDTRPVNLNLTKFAFPVTSHASILHRLSGFFLFFGTAGLLFALDLSLASEAGFDRLAALLQTPPAKLFAFVLLSALAYHFVAGVKHLLQDLGIGESLRGGVLAAWLTLLLGFGLAALIAFLLLQD